MLGANKRSDKIEITSTEKSNPKKTVFLYNVGAKKFMNAGNWWGTSPALSDVGIRCWISRDASYQYNADKAIETYVIETACQNNSKNAYKWNKLGMDDGSLFVDVSNQSDSKKRKTYWRIVPVDGKDNTYHIIQDYPGNASCNNRYLQVNGTIVFTGAELPANTEFAEWEIATEAAIQDLFKKTTIELGEDATDATYLIKDNNFDRYNSELSYWYWENGTGSVRVGIDNHYQTYTSSGSLTNVKYNEGSDDATGDDENNGKYWCAKIHYGSGTLYQTIQLQHTGWYILHCKGLYYEKNATSNKHAFLFAQAGDDKNTRVLSPLNFTSEVVEKFSDKSNPVKVNKEGSLFYADADGKYDNTVMVYVNCGQNNETTVNLKLGIVVQNAEDGTAVPTSGMGVAVDAFRLEYAGTPAKHDLIVDEEKTNFDYIINEYKYHVANHIDASYDNLVLRLRRTFTLNKWNTIVLPVNLTHTQFNKTFGAEAQLARYNGVKNQRLQFIIQDNKDAYDTGDDNYFLKANKPYLIKPVNGPDQTLPYGYDYYVANDKTEHVDISMTKNGEVYAPSYYTINGVSLNVDNLQSRYVEETSQSYDWEPTYIFCGTLTQNYEAPSTLLSESYDDVKNVVAGDYTYYKGELYPFDYSYGQKGLRCWFTPKQIGNAKVFGTDVNGISGETTGVDVMGLDVTQGSASRSHAIYNLNGQKVANDKLGDLPHGIYIVNGKKYIVK